MNTGILEHVNVTVSDVEKTAALLCTLFDWKIRWDGASMDNGRTIHVGSEFSYLALYTVNTPSPLSGRTYTTINGLNHIGIVVDDLDVAEKRILDAGFTTESHGDYEPGRRFYFSGHDGIEFEIISYAKKKSA